jgi:sugar phosphate isomerase/epimerase
MKIGMLTGLWYVAESASLIDSLRRAAALGFHYVDIHGVFHGGPAHLTAIERRAVKDELCALGLKPRNYVLHAPHNIPSSSDVELERSFDYLTEGVELALEWEINQLMLNAGQWDYCRRRSEAWERSVRFLQRMCDYASPRDIFIAQEPEPYVWFLVNDIASAKRMLEDVDRPNFTVLVDLGHMALARENPAELSLLNDAIIHAHFSDHQPFLHTNQEIGTGFAPIGDYLDMLHRMDVDHLVQRFGYEELVVSFELGVPGDQIPDPDERVRRSIQHVLQIAPYLSLT